MDRVRVRRITPSERQILQRYKRLRTNQVNCCHARIVLLSSGGVQNAKIAQLVDRTPQWVRKIIHRFNQGGVSAVQWRPASQARTARKFSGDVRQALMDVALSPPRTLIGMTQWSLSKLREYLVSQKLLPSISLSWLRELLRRQGVRWRRTKTWKESSDPQFKAKYHRLVRLYRHRPKGGRRICFDEFGPLSVQPRAGCCWIGRTCQSPDRLRATYHRASGVQHFLAVYDLETKQLDGRFYGYKTSAEILDCLAWLRRRYRTEETLYVVLDNYGPHVKKEVRAWAETHNIRFLYTPSNASWLNYIECQFTALKKFALENSDYRSHQELQRAIDSYLRWRNGQRRLALTRWGHTQAAPAPHVSHCRREAKSTKLANRKRH